MASALKKEKFDWSNLYFRHSQVCLASIGTLLFYPIIDKVTILRDSILDQVKQEGILSRPSEGQAKTV